MISPDQFSVICDQVSALERIGGQSRFCFRDDGEDGAERGMCERDLIGGGAYGIVAKCFDKKWNRNVAVKKMGWGTIEREVRRVIREIQVLRHVSHPNLVHLLGLYISEVGEDADQGSKRCPGVNPYSVFIVTELMDMPLSQLISAHRGAWTSGQRGQYQIEHVIWLTHQMLHGLHGMHSADIIHRDIKPHNLLVNMADTTLRICDFGLARCSRADHNISHYVVTRYYRAPEIVFGSKSLDSSMDVWAAGCVMAEMVVGDPLFAINSTTVDGRFHGARAAQALLRILNRIGKPCDEDIDAVPHDNVRQYLSKISPAHLEKNSTERDVKQHIKSNLKLPTEGDAAAKLEQVLDLIDCVLQFNPARRPSAKQLLVHNAFASFAKEELIHSCTPLGDVEPTDIPDFDFEPGVKLLKEEVAKTVIDEGWLEDECEEEEEVEEPAIQFLSTVATGTCPSQQLWTDLLKGHWMVIMAPALNALRISPDMEALLRLEPQQLIDLYKRVCPVMQDTALEFLNQHRGDLTSHVITIQNVTDLRPVIYGKLEEDSDLSDAIRQNLDFLVATTTLPLPPVASESLRDDVDWNTPAGDPDMEEDAMGDTEFVF